MVTIENTKYFKFTQESNAYVLKASVAFTDLAQALGMTLAQTTDGVLNAGQGQLLTYKSGTQNGILAPMVLNYRNPTNAFKRGRAKVGIPTSKIQDLNGLSGVKYGTNICVSIKFPERHDYR